MFQGSFHSSCSGHTSLISLDPTLIDLYSNLFIEGRSSVFWNILRSTNPNRIKLTPQSLFIVYPNIIKSPRNLYRVTDSHLRYEPILFIYISYIFIIYIHIFIYIYSICIFHLCSSFKTLDKVLWFVLTPRHLYHS